MTTWLTSLAVASVRCAARIAAQPPTRCRCGGACAWQLRHVAGAFCAKMLIVSVANEWSCDLSLPEMLS